jgi:hypothetical protein
MAIVGAAAVAHARASLRWMLVLVPVFVFAVFRRMVSRAELRALNAAADEAISARSAEEELRGAG